MSSTTSSNTNRVLDWSTAGSNLELTSRVLAVINPGRPQSVDYIKRLTEKAFYQDGLQSYVGTGGWYVTVFDTGTVDADGRQVWRAHVSIMAYSVAVHLNIPVR